MILVMGTISMFAVTVTNKAGQQPTQSQNVFRNLNPRTSRRRIARAVLGHLLNCHLCLANPMTLKGGEVDNDVLELKNCNLICDSDSKFQQPWAEYQEQLWSLFHTDSNFVNTCSDNFYVNCSNIPYVMNMCDHLVGNPRCGRVGNDISYQTPFDGKIIPNGKQNDRETTMNLQNHEHYVADGGVHNQTVYYQEPQSVRQPHSIYKVLNNTIEFPLHPCKCSTRWCTVQFLDRYWSDTDVNTTLVFISDDD